MVKLRPFVVAVIEFRSTLDEESRIWCLGTSAASSNTLGDTHAFEVPREGSSSAPAAAIVVIVKIGGGSPPGITSGSKERHPYPGVSTMLKHLPFPSNNR